SESSSGSAACCALRLLYGAARKLATGQSSRAATSRPVGDVVAAAPTIPARPRNPNTHSTQLAFSASLQRGSSWVFGVRRNAASLANRPWTDALVTVSI